MSAMINSMSPEEKENMMLKMMPEMMKRTDITELVPNLLETTGKMVSLYDLYVFISKGVQDEELKKNLSEKFSDLGENMGDMMGMMMPLMMSFMHKMMPMMMKMMPQMMEACASGGMANCSVEMQQSMAHCMQEMLPNCTKAVLPSLPSESRGEYVQELVEDVARQASKDMSEADKEDLQKVLFDRVVEGLYN